jgi:segregation and condensation protein B
VSELDGETEVFDDSTVVDDSHVFDRDEARTETPHRGESAGGSLVPVLEAVLFVLDAPVSAAQLASGLQCTVAEIDAALAELASSLDREGRGIEMRTVAGGVRLYSRSEYADVVAGFLLDGQRGKLSQAALETLAVIAYRQPVTRARISAIRGVNVDGVVRTLVARGLIVETGADAETGGGLYCTTGLFLEKLGLQSLDELPSLAPLLPDVDGLDVGEV